MQHHTPDQWFTQEQIERLRDLMTQWRSGRDRGRSIPVDKKAELKSLVEAELQATTLRTSISSTHE